MTKISNQVVYIPDTEINGLDYFIGTDYDNAKKTVNFRVEDLGSHFNMVNGVRNFDYIFYQHQGVNPTPTDGYFYSNGNTQIPEDIEYFIFPKKTYRGKDSSQFFLSIATENPFDLIIAQKIDNNTVFFFRIDSIETFTNYFKLNVSEVFFPDGKSLDYVLSYAVFNLKSEGGPSITKTSQLENDGEDGINPFITAQDLPSVPTKTSDLINDGSDGTSTYVETDELGAVATSNDYNDLDNLPTIPTVPNFADQTETNAGVVSDKTIAPNTLAGWWTYVKGLAQTFTERITFGKEIKLTPITTPTYEKGLVYFDNANDCISFLDSISGTSVQVGYEVLMRARNNTGTTILNGSVVYISGAIGQNSTVALAQANTLPTSEIIGIATHDIANNTVGKICVFGLVNDLNTSSFTDGQMLYLSATVAGGLTSTIPASPNYVVALGVVEHAHPTQGKILVKPQRALANNNALGTAQNVPPTQNAVKTANDLKQDVLVSGTNIKTINGESVLGTGDLNISTTNTQIFHWFGGNWTISTLNTVYYIGYNGGAIINQSTSGSPAATTASEAMNGRNKGLFVAPFNCKIKRVLFKEAGSGSFTGSFIVSSGLPNYGNTWNLSYSNIVTHINSAITSGGSWSNKYEYLVTDNILIPKGYIVSPMMIFSAQVSTSKLSIEISIEIEEVVWYNLY